MHWFYGILSKREDGMKTVTKDLLRHFVVSRSFRTIIIIMFVVALPATSFPHGVAGQRFFPTTFAVDDPFISDEFSVLYNYITMNDAEGGPQINVSSVDVGYAKRITPKFGIEVEESYQTLQTNDGGSVSGFGNLGVNLKYQFYTNAEHETILSVGVSDDIGHTGSRKIGAETFSTISPAIYFGKGFGDLPAVVDYLRPLAITGVVGENFPIEKTSDNVDNPISLTWSFTVQYSLMYLQSAVKDVGLGEPYSRMIAIVEFPHETCLNADCKNQTTSTINPGIAWIGKNTELGLALEIPMNSRSGAGPGVFVLFHLFLDDLFPKSIGRPIFP
jgi:hypothetical protein